MPPLSRYEEGILRNAAVLMMTEPELDFSSRGKLPQNVHYTGHAWEPSDTDWQPPWPAENRDPLVLISFSTTYMNQHDLARRALQAVSNLPVRALFTTGPALDPMGLAIPANVRVERFVPHTAVLPHAALTITHAGWATVQASLTASVPLVCIPDGRDQPDNAARVVEAGAGVRLRRSASPDQIRHAIVAALANPKLKAGAQRMASALGRRDGATAAAEMIERVGQRAGSGDYGPLTARQHASAISASCSSLSAISSALAARRTAGESPSSQMTSSGSGRSRAAMSGAVAAA